MILLFLILISLFQLLTYYLLDKYKLKFSKTLVFILVLLGYYFLFPQYFFPEPRKDGINCGIPVLAILLGFWVFGTIAALITHILWIIKLQKKNKNTLFDKD